MLNKKRVTCVICPNSCDIDVVYDEEKIISISKSKCKRGDVYATSECLNPSRTLTTTVKVIGGEKTLLPVKSSAPLPKGLLIDCMSIINEVQQKAPINVGEIIVKNILDTNIDIVAASRCSEGRLC
jgi:CxxC motif-containing protein